MLLLYQLSADFDVMRIYRLTKVAICVGAIVFGFFAGWRTWRGVTALCVGVLFNPIFPINFGAEIFVSVAYAASGVALIAAAPASMGLYNKIWKQCGDYMPKPARCSLALLGTSGIVLGGAFLWSAIVHDIQKGIAGRLRDDLERAARIELQEQMR